MAPRTSCVSLLVLVVWKHAAAFAPMGNTGSPHSFLVTLPKPVRRSTQVAMLHDPAELIQGFLSSTTSIADASDTLSGNEDAVAAISNEVGQQLSSSGAAASSQAAEIGNRGLSYYTTLALYALSFPGLWSTIKRSTKAKIKQKTYVSPGEAASGDGAKDLRQQAGEIMAYMKANNYEVASTDREVITFRGVVATSKSQAFFLTFCTALGLASLALVLQIQFIDFELPLIGKPNWFYLVLLSPYAGIYYWRSGDRVDEVKVKLASNEDDTENEVTIQADDEELDRMWRALELVEKGMVKVEGIMT